MKKKAVTGMKDILPGEMELRQYVLSAIRSTYRRFGFTEIETPVVEHLQNLNSKQGGENEKLIFKLLKRGEKLEKAFQSGDMDALSEEGLRYDLTVPLARFYAENQAALPNPFKALQIGPVFRADRPQRGRYRQFFQCDIDVFGDGSCLSEIELILAIGALLRRIGFLEKHPSHIVLNDREILRGMQQCAGFPAEDFARVCVILDKADKIGAAGVREELLSQGYASEAVEKYQSLLDGLGKGSEGVKLLSERLEGHLPEGVAERLLEIMEAVQISDNGLSLCFDPTLVRGMGYYTGPIFEIRAEDFPGSVGGGGRYDRMVGRFTGKDVPAVGFSIGFERIIAIMLEAGETVPGAVEKTAFLLDRKLNAAQRAGAIQEAMGCRRAGQAVLVTQMNKNKKFQKEQLSKEGYTSFKEFYPL